MATNHEIVLRGRRPLGRLQLVQSVTPVEVKIKEPDSGNNGIQQEVPGSGTKKPVQPCNEESGMTPMCMPTHIKDIDLKGLTPTQ